MFSASLANQEMTKMSREQAEITLWRCFSPRR